MKKTNLIEVDYQGLMVSFNKEAWFNATEAASHFGKRVDNWLRLDETVAYLDALKAGSNPSEVRYLKTKRGNNGGTWMHPDLAVHFARWLDVRFAVWCDRQIKQLITGTHPHHEQQQARIEASAGYKIVAEALQITRQEAGKATEPHHYANEARLINYAAFGQWQAVERDELSKQDVVVKYFQTPRSVFSPAISCS